MKTIVLLNSDMKNILRDRSMVFVMIAPVLILIILRIAPPIYESYFPIMVEYRPLIIGFFSVLTPLLAGFMFSFMMLDEKDQCLFPVFRVTPFSFEQLILYRVAIITCLGTLFSLLLILASGLVQIKLYQAILLAFLASLGGPVYSLLILSLAQNKIEGATYYKLLNMLLILPIIGMFIESPLRYLFGIIPVFWIFEAFESLSAPIACIINILIGLLMQLLYLIGAYRLFRWKNLE
jgi:hypothetical protein